MRITYLAQQYPPIISGASMVARQLAEAMVEKGHQVLVIAASERSEPYITQNGNLTVLHLQSHHNPLRVGQRFLLYPRRAILKALNDFQPDIIHSHCSLQIGMIGLEYAREAQIPITLTNHQVPGFVANCFPDKFGIRDSVEEVLWKYARWVLPQFTSIVAPTQTISALITKKTNIKCQTISNGVDLTTFHPSLPLENENVLRTKLGLPVGAPIILHVGQLHSTKHPDSVIRACAQVMQHSDAHLLVVGDGPQKAELVKACAQLGIADRSHFPGFLSVQQGLAEVYRLASLFVTASEIETQGIVLLEAVASGLPIVAVRATCIPEIVHHGVNGYLAEPGDIDGLSEAMIKILNNSSLAGEMGQKSYNMAHEHATRKTMDTYEQLYFEAKACRKYASSRIGKVQVAH